MTSVMVMTIVRVMAQNIVTKLSHTRLHFKRVVAVCSGTRLLAELSTHGDVRLAKINDCRHGESLKMALTEHVQDTL